MCVCMCVCIYIYIYIYIYIFTGNVSKLCNCIIQFVTQIIIHTAGVGGGGVCVVGGEQLAVGRTIYCPYPLKREMERDREKNRKQSNRGREITRRGGGRVGEIEGDSKKKEKNESQ